VFGLDQGAQSRERRGAAGAQQEVEQVIPRVTAAREQLYLNHGVSHFKSWGACP
jgi:hypothetical protein